MVEADGRRYVGPDNGLFEIVLRRSAAGGARRITWTPPRLSASFHGRDLFAPVAAKLASGAEVPTEALTDPRVRRPEWPDDLAEIIYIDHFGNAMTGLRAALLADDTVLVAGNRRISHARIFSEVATGEAFWYENANGLAEIAVNRGRADALGLAVGTPIAI